MRASSISTFVSTGTAVAAALLCSAPSGASADRHDFVPYGFQSGSFSTTTSPSQPLSPSESELVNDDSHPSSLYYDAQHNLLYFTGLTYGTYFDSAPLPNVAPEVKQAMGMSGLDGGRDATTPHLEGGDCFLGILKLPRHGGAFNDDAPWLIDMDTPSARSSSGPELIYARRFGTAHNPEACSSILMLPGVNDALLQTEAQLKLALLGHVNPVPLSSAELNAMGPVPEEREKGGEYYGADAAMGGGERRRRRLSASVEGNGEGGNNGKLSDSADDGRRRLAYDGNRGGFLHSLLGSGPVTRPGRAYGFVVDFDVSLTPDETFTVAAPEPSSPGDLDVAASGGGYVSNAYGAMLGGYVLDSSPLVYPVAIAQNSRDRNQLYVVSMHSDDEDGNGAVNPEYRDIVKYANFDGMPYERADTTLGGAGLGGGGGVPKFGMDFYVKVQQLTVTPYEQLMGVEPTADERVKRTMTSGWGFGFKLNDANDVRPAAVVFVKGRTPDEDLLLMGGTTRKDGAAEGEEGELDGFITKLIPPAPAPVADQTSGHDVQEAANVQEDEGSHLTKRIDSTTGRDETVTAICLPPPDPREGIVTHAFVVGSTSSDRGSGNSDPSIAYILKLRLSDLMTVWKAHVPSIHPPGIGGDVLGEGCAVTPDGKMVYLAGTIDGGAALNAGVNNIEVHPVGGKSDVFIVAYDVDFGNVQWARQLGTVSDDRLARGGGVAADNGGNAIIMGSTRGGLQRYRPEGGGGGHGRRGLQGSSGHRLASDVFIMSLSRTDGAYVNAPYTTGDDGTMAGMASAASGVEGLLDSKGGGMSGGAIAGIVLFALGLAAALSLYAVRRDRASKRQLGGENGDVMRAWDRGGAGNFNFDAERSLGGRRMSNHSPPSGSLSIARGGSGDEWDDGTDRLSRNATWMAPRGGGAGGGGGDDDSSVHSASSSGSRSYTSKQTEDNVDFLSSLRREADTTMKEMIKETPVEDNTTDPRLDGGVSIKSLLTHYREVKKGGLMHEEEGGGKAGERRKGKGKGNKPPPPPPPPRRKNDANVAPSTPDGLSEFTII